MNFEIEYIDDWFQCFQWFESSSLGWKPYNNSTLKDDIMLENFLITRQPTQIKKGGNLGVSSLEITKPDFSHKVETLCSYLSL